MTSELGNFLSFVYLDYKNNTYVHKLVTDRSGTRKFGFGVGKCREEMGLGQVEQGYFFIFFAKFDDFSKWST